MPVFLFFLALFIYVGLIWLFFAVAAIWIFRIGIAAMVAMICYRYFLALGANLFWGMGWEEKPVPPEPAYKNYFFNKAWQDYWLVPQQAWPPIWADIQKVFTIGLSCMNAVGWPLGLTIWAVAAAAFVPAALVLVLLGGVHLLVVGSLASIAYAAAFVLRVVEAFNLLVLVRFHGRCPHCSRRLALPVYVCKCGAKHQNLVPGSYGSLFRRCQCGEELPTLFLLGRNDARHGMEMLCRECTQVIHAEWGLVRDIFIPIVGGTSTGKSSLMTATLVELENGVGGLKVTFPKANSEAQSADQRNYMRAKGQYLSGQTVDKTSDSQVKAFRVMLEDNQTNKRLVFAYDAAGEIFRPGHHLGNLPYYEYIHGLIFLVDPFAMSGTHSGLSIGSPSGLAASADSAKDIYDKVVRALLAYSKRADVRSVPLAIVVSKSDALRIREKILATTVPVSEGSKAFPPEDVYSRTVREWLLTNGEGPLVRSAEQDFKNVRYFECSALGRVPGSSGSAFQAYGVVEPWGWILQQSRLRVSIRAKAAAL